MVEYGFRNNGAFQTMGSKFAESLSLLLQLFYHCNKLQKVYKQHHLLIEAYFLLGHYSKREQVPQTGGEMKKRTI